MPDELTIFNKKSESASMEAQEKDTIERLRDIENLCKLVMTPKMIVACPTTPVEISGIVAGDALDANDCMGNIVKVAVPKSGVIYSATFFDLDDEGTQVDLEIFKNSIAQVASDAAFAPTDAEILSFLYELRFFAFDDHGSCQTSTVENIGHAYTAPEGFFYIQAVTRSTPNIAAGAMPRFQLQIQSFDPDFGGNV